MTCHTAINPRGHCTRHHVTFPRDGVTENMSSSNERRIASGAGAESVSHPRTGK